MAAAIDGPKTDYVERIGAGDGVGSLRDEEVH